MSPCGGVHSPPQQPPALLPLRTITGAGEAPATAQNSTLAFVRWEGQMRARRLLVAGPRAVMRQNIAAEIGVVVSCDSKAPADPSVATAPA